MFESYYPLGGIEDFKGSFDSVNDAIEEAGKIFGENTELVHDQIVDVSDKVIYVSEWQLEDMKEVRGFEIKILES